MSKCYTEPYVISSANMGAESPLPDIKNNAYIHAKIEVTENVTDEDKKHIGDGMIPTLLPYHEQPKERVKEGQTVLVAVYIDKSERLCATMNVYPWLRTDSPYHTGDQVTGIVYETSRNFGAFVAVDSIYSALIPRRELVRELKAGDVVQARVTGIKPDGKIDLSIREKGFLQIEEDARTILKMLKDRDGVIPFTDKASPELIREETHMSKNEFKRAVGHLLKENKISIEEDRIILL